MASPSQPIQNLAGKLSDSDGFAAPFRVPPSYLHAADGDPPLYFITVHPVCLSQREAANHAT